MQKYFNDLVCNLNKNIYLCDPIERKHFLLIRNDPVAQPVEHITFNDGVLGSNPNGITDQKENENEKQKKCFKLAFSFLMA